jgi:hypothetical protein
MCLDAQICEQEVFYVVREKLPHIEHEADEAW